MGGGDGKAGGEAGGLGRRGARRLGAGVAGGRVGRAMVCGSQDLVEMFRRTVGGRSSRQSW